MKKLYIHIGLPKTGTTIIQSILKDKVKELDWEKIALINFDEITCEIREGKIPDCNAFFKNLDQKLSNEYRLLISSEFLCGIGNMAFTQSLSPDALAPIFVTAKKYFDVHLIIYLRRIDLWLESLYTQAISDGQTLSFDEYLEKNKVYNLDFYKLISTFSNHLGKDKMIVRLYDKKYQPERNSLIKDFADIIGSKMMRDVDPKNYMSMKTNTGFDKTAVEIARLCNTHADTGQLKEIRRILQYAVNKELFTKNIYFTMEKRRKLLDNHAKAEEKIKKEFFPDLKGKLFPPAKDMKSDFDDLRLGEAVRTLMFAVMAPSPYEHILTLRSLHLLYKMENFLKKFSFIKTLGKKVLRIFGIRDKNTNI